MNILFSKRVPTNYQQEILVKRKKIHGWGHAQNIDKKKQKNTEKSNLIKFDQNHVFDQI